MTVLQGLEFIKLEGCGNHFVVAEAPAAKLPEASEVSRLLNPNFGIAADGLMLVSRDPRADFKVAMFNPDGTDMGMCGNGIRCVMRYVLLKGLARNAALSFQVNERVIKCSTKDEGRTVRVDMGRPIFTPDSIPCTAPVGPAGTFELKIGSLALEAFPVSMGNPHCVLFVQNLEEVDFESLGPTIERHEFFPKRTNVEFVQRISAGELRVKVWERAAGPTMACGTGACAAAVAGFHRGLSADECSVSLPGGTLKITYSAGDTVYMEGPAREVYQGRLF